MKRFTGRMFPRGLSSTFGMSPGYVHSTTDEKTKLGEMQRSTNQARCNPSISLLHFYYSHSSHYSYCITNWLVARILYNLAHFLGIAHARSGCNALRPSNITFATPSEKWSFLMIVLRDHCQFSRSKPTPLPVGN